MEIDKDRIEVGLERWNIYSHDVGSVEDNFYVEVDFMKQNFTKFAFVYTTSVKKSKVLAAHGATKIRNPETALTYFWITDSCPLTVKEVTNQPPFELLSLASSISASLQI
ncbi:unnamed protein product [Lupinus luteus]|uniref:Uncharacterized protein n=1 Tax=Lupinus luteus TaxID=3873 RepID=A0AAV1WYF0_LUPLU